MVSAGIAAEFDVPIGEVEEMLPIVVNRASKGDLHKGSPFGALWFPNEPEPRLGGGAIGFTGITGNTRTNDIFPSGRAAAIAGNDVIKIQIFAIKHAAAVLAHVFVSFEEVMPREFHFLSWHSIKG